MTVRMRWVALALVVAVVLSGAAAYGVSAYLGRGAPAAVSHAATRVQAPAGPRIVFRNTAAGAGYGLVAAVPLGDPAAARAITDRACDRVYATQQYLSCLRIKRGVVTTFEADLFDRAGVQQDSWPLPGIPSRTRISPDSRLVASTAFITGMAYATVGFSTQTVIRGTDGHDYGNLENFTTVIDGKKLTAADRNFWGVTFGADDNVFYATAASGGHSWLVRGDLAQRTLTSIHDGVECPSLSPDGTRIAFKKNVSSGPVSHWAIAVLDLATGAETVLGEKRSVDDQVEWLGNDTLLYGLPRTDAPGDSDVWSVASDGSTVPVLLIPHAWSPSVVRP
jgi:hypothetical protein